MSDHRAGPTPRRGAPLTRGERAALAQLADGLDRDDPVLAAELRGPAGAGRLDRRSREPGRRVLAVLLFLVFALHGIGALVLWASAFWGATGLLVSSVAVAAVAAALTLRAVTRAPRPRRRIRARG